MLIRAWLARTILLLMLLCPWQSVFSQTSSNTITLAFGYENYDFAPLIKKFELQTNIKVNIAGYKNDLLKVELLQRAKNNSLPDAVIVPADFLGIKDIGFLTLSVDWINPNVGKTNLMAVSHRQQIKGVPVIAGNHLLLYYNKALVKQPARSWVELQQQKQTLNSDKQIDLIGWSYNEMFWFAPFLNAFGGSPLANNQVNLNTAAMRQAMTFYHQLAKSGLVNENCDYECSSNKFTQQQLRYVYNGVWAYGLYQKALGDNLGITRLPAIGKRPMKPYFSVHALGFPSTLSNKSNKKLTDNLKQLALFFQSEATQLAMWQNLNSLPVHQNVMQQILLNADDNLQAIIRQLVDAEPMPNDLAMSIVWEAMLKGNRRYWADVFDVNQASRYMQHIATKSVEELSQD
ncbi:hypothetical protein C2869_06770 [Saccharobesus litoralis]|uniref:ABC transporter substrate-binding protein n=1 Tax=Saccharobesus litoralis TaxID=2172099 RepID=A0A2S0VPL8_9ALTE|nr:extracellular solute-binding protein [Saccharobesus litoralis]AWB66156.1 hypothetical protein C2869_06770 [Saccharobesus litoralis]